MDKNKVAQDPVCLMYIETDKALATSTYKDKTYYFCSHMCKERFDKAFDKEQFIVQMDKSMQ